MHLPHPAPPTDEVLEDCLQAIHRLEGQGGAANLREVAAFARITPATASEALRDLQDRGLVRNGQPGSVTLTSEGRRQAAGKPAHDVASGPKECVTDGTASAAPVRCAEVVELTRHDVCVVRWSHDMRGAVWN